MQNDRMMTRGYNPHQPMVQPPEVSFADKMKALWQLLNPAAVAALGAMLLGLGYAIFITANYWWVDKLMAHLIFAWVSVAVNGYGLFTSKREMLFVAMIAYVVAALLFINYAYLLIIQPLLCFYAWRRL